MSNVNARKALKSIVKECLMEILSEGLNSGTARSMVAEGQPSARTTVKSSQPARKPSAKPDSRIDEMVNAVTSDDVMRSILADTAKSTLVEQLQHESRGASANPDPTVGSGIDLNSMFSEASNSWSEMAFGNRKNGAR